MLKQKTAVKKIECTVSGSTSGSSEEHDFTYKTMDLIEATEDHVGYRAHICRCGAYYIEIIPKLGKEDTEE